MRGRVRGGSIHSPGRPPAVCAVCLPLSLVWATRALGFTGTVMTRTTRSTAGELSIMPLSGTYEPSPSDWARDHVERFEASGGTLEDTSRGMSIIVMTSVGSRSGKQRKTPLMRVEHDGEYAVVASLG